MKNEYTKFGYALAKPAWVLTISILLFSQMATAQSCPSTTTTNINSYPNTYYPASQASVPAGSTSIVLGSAYYGSTPISTGDILLIIQMQGAQINSSNNSNYGDASGDGSGYLSNSQLTAGNMEYVIAASNLGTGGGTLTISSGLANSYQNTPFGTDGQYTYQVIRVPIYYDLKLTGTITAPRWDGYSGGVVVLYATDKILMNSQTIDASGLGFRGGGGRAFTGSGAGSSADFITSSAYNANGSKGEGIAGTPKYLNHNNSFLDVSGTEGYPNGSYAKGAPANAGGGGTDGNPASNNDENTGGGGGANGGAGGYGGNSWNSNLAVGGRPGSVFTQASASRLIMGGGGGAGTTNNATGTPGNGFASSGTAGGGIIILIGQNGITGTGTIKANGVSANSTVQNDGSGGGGAGGSVLVYSGNGTTSNLTIQAKGGNGGSNETTSGPSHGPGGGGGGGVVYSNATLNAASTVAGGTAGTTNGQTTNYGATSGAIGAMITTMSASAPAQVPLSCVTLPVSFTGITAVKNGDAADLNWQVSYEINTLKYVVERSTDGINFSDIGSTPFREGNGLNNAYQYSDKDLPAGSGKIYYRIREVDVDGTVAYSKTVSVQQSALAGKLSVYPNPARTSVTVSYNHSVGGMVSLRLFDLKGSLIWQQQQTAAAGQNNVQIDYIRNLPAGVYILQWFDGLTPEQTKILVDR